MYVNPKQQCANNSFDNRLNHQVVNVFKDNARPLKETIPSLNGTIREKEKIQPNENKE